jgi:predicted RNA-binding Zn ribbon-like protein
MMGPTVTQNAPRPLPVVAGHLALDFVDTVDAPAGSGAFDHLSSYPQLIAWSHHAGVVSERQAQRLGVQASRYPRRARVALRRTHELRAVIDAAFRRNAAGHLAPSETWPQLRPFVLAATAKLEFRADGNRLAESWPDSEELQSPLWPIAYAAAQLLTSDQLSRIKQCAGCHWLFLDHSKNYSRRWCAMADCGTQEKIRLRHERGRPPG